MARLVIVFLALFALQGALCGGEGENFAKLIETETREYVDLLQSRGYTKDVENSLEAYRHCLETLVGKLHQQPHTRIGRLDLTLEELVEKLRKILQVLQGGETAIKSDIPRHLKEVVGIFDKLTAFIKTEEESTETYKLVQDILVEYCFALKNAVRTLTVPKTMRSNGLKMQTENILREILDDYLKQVHFDKVHVKNAMMTVIRYYVRDLKKYLPEEVLLNLKMFLEKGESGNGLECHKLLTAGFNDLLKFVEESKVDQKIFMRLLATTYVLEFNICTMCIPDTLQGETTTNFGVQIRSTTNGVINTLKGLSFGDKHAKRILVDQTHELIQNLESIVEKLQQVHMEYIQIATIELNKIIVELKRLIESVDRLGEDEIKMDLARCLQLSTIQIQKLLSLERENRDPQKTQLYGVFYDYLALLQHQLIQFQNIYQSTTGKQSLIHMGKQIQTITNSVILYLRNVPTNDVMIREKLEVQVHHLVNRIRRILLRIKDINDPGFVKVWKRLDKITESFEAFMEKLKVASIAEVVFHFNVLAQRVAVEMKNFSWLGRDAKLEEVVRSILAEYLIIIENIQVKMQRINQVSQLGASPRELALQIEIVADHLRRMLTVFVSNNPLSLRTFEWEISHFVQVLETIADQLTSKKVSHSGMVYKEVGSNLKRVADELKNLDDHDLHMYRMKVTKKIVMAAEEVQKLCWISQADIQEGLGAQTTYIRSILLDLLLNLQNFHIQMMHNYQVVASGQSPTKTLMEIEQMPKVLLKKLQTIKSDFDLEQILTVQLGEYLQTVENTMNSLHHEMKTYGEHSVEIEKVADVLGKMSLLLQNVDVRNFKEFWMKFEMSLNEFVKGMHTLVALNYEKVSKTHYGTHTGILHGVLSNMLATLKNMYVQLHYTQHAAEGVKINVLGDRIAVITNNVMPSLETIVGSTTPIKQALGVQIFYYARNLRNVIRIIERLEDKEVVEVVKKLRLALSVVQQTGSSMTTLTINDLKLHFNKLIQGVGNSMQQLIVFKTENKDTEDVILHVLLRYLRALKNVHLQIQNISRMSHQSENYQLVAMQIDSAIIELCKFLQVLPREQRLLAKVVVVQGHEMAQLILNIINRYQAAAVVQDNDLFMEIATELKKIQVFLHELTERKVLEDLSETVVELASRMERATVLIEQLMWIPVKTVHGAQYRPDMPTFVRVTLHDFLSAVQNMFLQIANVIVNVDDNGFEQMVNGHVEKISEGVKMPKSDVLYNPEWELFRGMFKKTNDYGEMLKKTNDYEGLSKTNYMNMRMMYQRVWPYYKEMTMTTSFYPMMQKNSWLYPRMDTMMDRNRYQLEGMPHHYRETPMTVVQNIEVATKRVSEVLRKMDLTKNTMIDLIHRLSAILDDISKKMQVPSVADNLRNLKLAFDSILRRSDALDVDRIKNEIIENLEMVLKQFDDLVRIHEMRTSTLVHTVLERYGNHLQMALRRLETPQPF